MGRYVYLSFPLKTKLLLSCTSRVQFFPVTSLELAERNCWKVLVYSCSTPVA